MKPEGSVRLRVVPLTLGQANALVRSLHRHHRPVAGHRFSVGAEAEDGRLVGAAICGRPVARLTDQYRILEITRLVTDGTPNACSFLYAAASRVAREMGFEYIQTYTLDREPGTSMRAAGWEQAGETGGDTWSKRGRSRSDQHPTGPKRLWRRRLSPSSASPTPTTCSRSTGSPSPTATSSSTPGT